MYSDELCSFTARQAEDAYDIWRSNCGPAALAAILGRSLEDIRPMMGDFEKKFYTNPTLMCESLTRCGVKWRRVAVCELSQIPARALVRVQWEGPWMNQGVPMAARYRHTHWIAAKPDVTFDAIVFDVNAMSVGGWIPLEMWTDSLVPWLIQSCCPRGNGKWSVTHILEVL